MTLFKENHCFPETPGVKLQKEEGVSFDQIIRVLCPQVPFVLLDTLKSNRKVTARERIYFKLTCCQIFSNLPPCSQIYPGSNLTLLGCRIASSSAQPQLSMAGFLLSGEHKAPPLHTQPPRGRTLTRRVSGADLSRGKVQQHQSTLPGILGFPASPRGHSRCCRMPSMQLPLSLEAPWAWEDLNTSIP